MESHHLCQVPRAAASKLAFDTDSGPKFAKMRVELVLKLSHTFATNIS